MTTLDKWCDPKLHWMKSQNLNDAKKECLDNPSCDMFYDQKGAGTDFGACGVTASIRSSSIGSILYTKRGNKSFNI